MLDELQLFRNSTSGSCFRISEHIGLKPPSLGEICDFGEHRYFSIIAKLCANSSQYKVFLWDNGVDWTKLTDYDLFCLMYKHLLPGDTSIILNNLNLPDLITMQNLETGEIILGIRDEKGGFTYVIDRAIYTQLSDYIRKIHGIKNKGDIPYDEHTKKYMIERERKRIARRKTKSIKENQKSILKPIISSLVNLPGFKYDYSTIWDLPVSALTESINTYQKFFKNIQYFQAVYAGFEPRDIEFEEQHIFL
ncbi:MAG: hypothetical protein FWG70_11900 [Oscillospiraceae bacterium]|nr:hypothetical protein [Oscillospiraceae bacterium]